MDAETLRQFQGRALASLKAFLPEFELRYPVFRFSAACYDDVVVFSALNPTAPPKIPDLVEFVISCRRYPDGLDMIDVDVIWGDGCGEVEGQFLENAVQATPEVFDQIYEDIPRLMAVLETAVKRGRPLSF